MIAIVIRSMTALLLPALVSLSAQAQVSPKLWRIGIAFPGFSEEAIASRSIPVQPLFEEGLRELGWIEGKNIQLLYRGPTGGKDGKPEATAVDQLLRLSVDVLVAFGNNTTEEAMRATSTIPIVARLDSAVQSGVVKSLSRPGGNVTGISVEDQGGLAMKRLALLKETAPVKRVARLYFGPPLRFGTDKELLPEYAAAAHTLHLEIFPVGFELPGTANRSRRA